MQKLHPTLFQTMKYSFRPAGVCARQIDFEIDSQGILHNVTFIGGCHGNTQGVTALSEGRSAAEICRLLGGINCKGKGTSCPDQLALAIGEALSRK